MEPEVKNDVIVDDESALDKELEESISAVKAGNALAPTEPVAPEVKQGDAPVVPKEELISPAPTAEDKKEDGYEFRIPNKGKFESDESYEKRIELLDLVKKRKLATTPEAKQALTEQISTAKGQLKNLNSADKIINPNPGESPIQPEMDEVKKADLERAKELGMVTKEDIQDILAQERATADTKNTLEKFVERYPDLKDDQDVREVFFAFVDANYNWQGKVGKELMTVLELARENMFKPSETIQERVLKGANVQEKINAMQFPGGNLPKVAHSPEMQKSIDELKATGMSEEKALELLSE